MTPTSTTNRIAWVDAAKAYGIMLVFYGHFVEKWALLGNDAALMQWKLIYAFHMPLFFFLAGYVFKAPAAGLGAHVRRGLILRIAPALVFNLLAALYIIGRRLATGAETEAAGILFGVMRLVSGKPVINFLTWFLVCLFTVELLHFLLGRYLNTVWKMAVGSLVTYGLGWLMWKNIKLVVEVTGVPVNFWYAHEAVVAYAIYLTGVAARAGNLFERIGSLWLRLTLLGGASAVTLATFNLNMPQGNVRKSGVIMATGTHGDFVLFPLTALAGIATVILLAQLTPSFKPFNWVGLNTLVLFGFNGVIWLDNPAFARMIAPYFGDAHLTVLAGCALVTAAQILVAVPLVWLLNKTVPQLVGRARQNGPVFRPLL